MQWAVFSVKSTKPPQYYRKFYELTTALKVTRFDFSTHYFSIFQLSNSSFISLNSLEELPGNQTRNLGNWYSKFQKVKPCSWYKNIAAGIKTLSNNFKTACSIHNIRVIPSMRSDFRINQHVNSQYFFFKAMTHRSRTNQNKTAAH